MTIKQMNEMLELAKDSGLHSLVYGREGVGKTSFCRQKYPEALVILQNELHDNNILFLKTAFETNHVIILENITEGNLAFLVSILNNRTILGKKLDNFFIITAREKIDIPNTLPIEFLPPSSVAWLDWAVKNDIHPAIIEAINSKDLLEGHRPRDLEALSNILKNDISNDLLDPIVTSFLKHDLETVELIKNYFLKEGHRPAAQTANKPSFDRFDIQSMYEDRSEKSSFTDKDGTLEHLKVLLNEPHSEFELSELLEQKDIKKIIDDALRKII